MRARFPFSIAGILLAFATTAVAQGPRPEWPKSLTLASINPRVDLRLYSSASRFTAALAGFLILKPIQQCNEGAIAPACRIRMAPW
jgi:hypothetical protein